MRVNCIVTVYVRKILTYLLTFLNMYANVIIGVARGCTGCKCTPRAEKKIGGGGKFAVESCKCTPGRTRVQFLRKLGRFGRWERLFR